MKQDFFIIGCGKMGSAMLEGWLAGGAGDETNFIIIDPYFAPETLSPTARATKAVFHYASLGEAGAAGHNQPRQMLLSVKPQMMAEALSDISDCDISDCVFISIAAGLSLKKITTLISDAPIRLIRTMPNTPAAIGKGMTALIGNAHATDDDLALAERLLSVCGQVVRLSSEADMDAVTALSGSGPAYVFLLAEEMAKAGAELGLSDELSRILAEQTIYGAGALLAQSKDSAAQLRQNVTSKGGTTAAALSVLLAQEGMADLLSKAMAAAHQRAKELDR